MNIGSKSGYPSSALSNFAPHKFNFRGVECNSLEGVLQSFKFDKPHIQHEVCKLVGLAAKKRGKARNQHWQQRQMLWWAGEGFYRDSEEYQMLLDELYMTVYDQCEGFRKALVATGSATLTHSIGSSKQSMTVLTEREFCSRLMWLRDVYSKIGDKNG